MKAKARSIAETLLRAMKHNDTRELAEGEEMDARDTVSCEDCRYCKGTRCTLWEVKIDDPSDSHCEVVLGDYGRKAAH